MRSASVALVFLLACSDSQAGEPEVVRVPVTIQTGSGPITFQAELAVKPAERSQGLMFRTELEPDHGMLFVFPVEAQQSFWMKNTLIPLDIIFIKADRTILGIVHNAEPQTLTSRRVQGASQYVLELAGGTAETRGIDAGQRVTFMAPSADR